MESIPYTRGDIQILTVHDAITADVLVAAAEAHLCAGAKSIALMLTEGGTVNNRQVDMAVYVSVDGGTTFALYAKLIDNAVNANSETVAHVNTKNRAAAGTDIMFFDPDTVGSITHFKVQMDVTDAAAPTGNFTVKVAIKY